MKQRLSIFVIMLAGSAALHAQDLTPNVVITNEFEGKVLEAAKDSFTPTVPDSVLSFDWNFNYSVFDSPYRGSYSFSPYEISVSKSPSEVQLKRFYLKAGAGYTFHPEFYFSFNPRLKGNFSCALENDFKGYSGPYVGTGERFHGYDMSENINFRSIVDAESHIFSFGAGYGFIAAGDTVRSRFLQCVDLSAAVRSNAGPDSRSRYSAGVYSRFVSDRLSSMDPRSTGVLLGGNFNYEYALSDRSGLDFLFAGKHYTGGNAPAFIRIRPSYSLRVRDFELDLGVRGDILAEMGKNWPLFPDVRVRKALLKDKLYATASVTGGSDLLNVSDLVSIYHHTTCVSSMVQTEGLRTQLSFDGRVFESLQYTFDAGYVHYSKGILESTPSLQSGIETLTSEEYGEAYLKAAFKWIGARVEAYENVRLSSFSGVDGIAPSAFSTDGYMNVFFSRRFSAGADLETAFSRKGLCAESGESLSIPGYVDLDLHAEYRLRGSFSVWAKMGNILAQPVRRSLLYAEPSFNLMAGIVLNIR